MEASRGRLMAIIKTQSEIAASDLDMDQVMHLVAKRAQEITDATSAVIELPEGDEMVYAVTSGEATPYLGIRMDRRSTLSGRSSRCPASATPMLAVTSAMPASMTDGCATPMAMRSASPCAA